jgi:PAS domain S-box-containing protein
MTNRAFATMLGLRVEELLGLSEPALIRRLEDRGAGAESIARALEDRESVGETAQRITLAGEPPREIQLRVAVLRGQAGERLGRIVACRDRTEQRQAERELQARAEELQLGKVELEQAQCELGQVNAKLEARSHDLEKLNRELRRLDQMRTELLGNVSHELQTPLVAVRGYTEMILKERLGPVTEEQRKGLRLSLKNIDRLISMIDHLLAFSRMDPSLRDLELAQFDLEPVVTEAVDTLRNRISDKELEVRLALQSGLPQLEADRNKVLQVFLNLISNAIKFSHRGGLIEISAGPGRAGYVAVRLRDTGVGIPEEALGRIFERHFQALREGQERPEGSGLGLAIVRDILRVHGCTIEVRSEEGRGTEFTFTLPLAREQQGGVQPVAEADQVPEPPPAPTSPSTSSTAPETPPEPSGPPRPRLRIIRRTEPVD